MCFVNSPSNGNKEKKKIKFNYFSPKCFSHCRVTPCQKSASSSESLAGSLPGGLSRPPVDLSNVSDTVLKLHLH